jgi:WD40 repeat protein
VKRVSARSGIVVGDGFIAAHNKDSLYIYTHDREHVEFLNGDHRPCAAAGKLLAIGDETGRIALRDALAKVDVTSEHVHGWYVTAVAIDPTGSLIASGGRDGTILVRPLSID